MDALFCPLAADVGKWADWVNVVAATVVGVGVWRVSSRTNKLAQAANRTSESVAQLEIQRESEAAKLRQDEQRLILVTLANPIALALAAVRSARGMLERDGYPGYLRDEAIRQIFITNLRLGQLTVPESVRARMHFVDTLTAAQILRAEGAFPLLFTAIEGMGTASPSVAENGLTALKQALSRETKELEEAWTRCLDACREAGLGVGPDIFGPGADVIQASSQ